MHALAKYREALYKKPELRELFLELTLNCNEHCFHCGSRCGDVRSGELSIEQYRELLEEVRRNFPDSLPRICITGGEPMLRRDFEAIAGMIHEMGFRWGMTSNGTLIDEKAAHMLRETGMGTISISIDGLRETHDRYRRSPGAYDRAMRGIGALIREGGFHAIQVTTVIHKGNIDELDEMFEVMDGIDIDSWRVIGMEPIGRARDFPDLLPDASDQRRILAFIRSKRALGYPVTYGCSHYLGIEYEREVRDWYFLCNAGVYVASVMANGDIGACLDIERRPETIMGNIRTDSFTDVWRNRFEIFRSEPAERNAGCRACESREFCAGDSWHSWDFDRNAPMICFKTP
jgi:radical SAM protein with 4Fe4S-binding SPASM domain